MKAIKQLPPVHNTLTGYDFTVDSPLRPLKAIRTKCLECQAGNAAEVKRCELSDCALWPYRMGRNPNRKGIGGKGFKSSTEPGSPDEDEMDEPEVESSADTPQAAN